MKNLIIAFVILLPKFCAAQNCPEINPIVIYTDSFVCQGKVSARFGVEPNDNYQKFYWKNPNGDVVEKMMGLANTVTTYIGKWELTIVDRCGNRKTLMFNLYPICEPAISINQSNNETPLQTNPATITSRDNIELAATVKMQACLSKVPNNNPQPSLNNISPISYRWFKNGVKIERASRPKFITTGAGEYKVMVNTKCGTYYSNIIVLDIPK